MTQQFSKGDLVRVAADTKSIFGNEAYSGALAIVLHEKETWFGQEVVFIIGIDQNDPLNLDKAYAPTHLTLVKEKFFTEEDTTRFFTGPRPKDLAARFEQAEKEFATTTQVEKVVFARDLREGDFVLVDGASLEVVAAVADPARLNRVNLILSGLPVGSYRADHQFTASVTESVAVEEEKEDPDFIPVGRIVEFTAFGEGSRYEKVSENQWRYVGNGYYHGSTYTDGDVGGRVRRGEPHTVLA